MESDETRPTLNFFRATPPDMLEWPPLASSLQNFETCLFLIALGRYPSAVMSCANAWESAIKARLKILQNEHKQLFQLLDDVRSKFEPLRSFDERRVTEFRNGSPRQISAWATSAARMGKDLPCNSNHQAWARNPGWLSRNIEPSAQFARYVLTWRSSRQPQTIPAAHPCRQLGRERTKAFCALR
jgi:hypothetical protein